MGWFSRTPKTDPIGDICRLLVEKPWEWIPADSTDDNPTPTLYHVSGVWVSWDRQGYNGGARAWLGFGAGLTGERVAKCEAARLYTGIMCLAAARVARPRVDMGDATKAMARAVLEGDAEAARLLADWVMEHCGATKGAA